jgi:hypothetical protein
MLVRESSLFITITILDIMHCPFLYLKLNQIYKFIRANRLMLPVGLWRWYINITIGFIFKNFIH